MAIKKRDVEIDNIVVTPTETLTIEVWTEDPEDADFTIVHKVHIDPGQIGPPKLSFTKDFQLTVIDEEK